MRAKRRESLHEQIIDRLVASTPGAERFRFKQRVLDAVWGGCGSHEVRLADEDEPESRYEDCDRCLFDEQIGNAPRPDAFVVDTGNLEIIAYEVEVSHQVDFERVMRYADLLWVVDEEEWLVRLIVVDRFEKHTEIDVLETEWDALNPNLTSDQKINIRTSMGIRPPGVKLGDLAPVDEES